MAENEIINIEYERNLDKAIEYIENNHKRDLDDYLQIIFLLTDFVSNGQYSEDKHNYYAGLLKKYFIESYCKYSYNSEYLFYVAFIASMSEWYFEIEMKEIESMLAEAARLEPENLLYKWGFYSISDQQSNINTEDKYSLSKQILEDNILVEKIEQKGLLGEYLKGFILSIYESTKVLLQ